MTQRTHAVALLAAYFEKHGGIMTHAEYKKRTDTPIRFARVKTIFGSWNRMERIVRVFNGRNFRSPDYIPSTDADEVVRKNAEAQALYAETIRAASENLEAKTAREAAAAAHREADAMRAKTVEGVIENKLRKGGVTSQDDKAKKEAIEQAVAEEHALLAQTAAGAALGKELLGGVEDNDEKTIAIAEQNAFREKKALLAITPEGSAQAVLMEDDTDGALSREAQARIRNELRPYVPPVTAGSAEQATDEAVQVVRDEVRAVVKAAASDENVDLPADQKATEARLAVGVDYNVELTPELIEKMPPADQPVDPDFALASAQEALDKEDTGAKKAAPAKAPVKVDPKPATTAKAPEVKEVTASSPSNPNTKTEAKKN